MKTFLASLCFVLVCASITKAQQVSLLPLVAEAELVESSSPSEITVLLTLKEPGSAAEKQVAFEDIQFQSCTAVDGSKRVVSGVNINSTDKLHPRCTFKLGLENNNLRPDWNKFLLEVNYKIREGGALGALETFRGNSPLTRCTRVSEITASLNNALRTGDRELTIPIAVNTDARLNVELKKTDGSTVATVSGKDKADVLFEKDTEKPVVLKVVEGKVLEPDTVVYEVFVSQLPSQPSTTIQVKGDKTFRLKEYRPFQLSNLTAMPKDDDSYEVNFTSSTTGKLKAFINGREKPVYDGTVIGVSRFTIPAAEIAVGANTLNFSGESTENNLKLTGNPTVSFIKAPKPTLKDTPVSFTYEEGTNTLKINFMLSHKLETRWQFKGAEGLGRDVILKEDGKSYEAVINLGIGEFATTVERKLTEVQDSPLKTAPVEIEIVNKNKSGEIIASFRINFIKPKESVIAKVKAAETQAKSGHSDTAKKLIAEALGFIGDFTKNPEQKAIVDAAVPQLKQSGSSQSKVYKVLGIAGKLALGIFGIPLPIPS